MQYWEANILANPRLEKDLKFFIGSYTTHFGTHTGKMLQDLASSLGVPLFWAFMPAPYGRIR